MIQDFGKTLEQDARNCLLVLAALLVAAVGMGMGLYHLIFAK